MPEFRKTEPIRTDAYRIIHASRLRAQSGGIEFNSLAPDGDSIEAAAGAWADYGPADFGEGTDVCMAYAAAASGPRRIELRIDSPAGGLIADLPIAPTGDADLFREHYAPLSSVRGVHDLFLVFPEGPVGLDWLLFSKDPEGETGDRRTERIGWWREARFGQFVHWGPYAVLGRGEWVMYQEQWARQEYEIRAAAKFHPSRFRAADWLRLLADAGQRYLVVTAKHHDGFCMFDTRIRGFDPVGDSVSGRYDIADFSPGRGDPLRDLERECRRRGIRFGVYYSILDWHHRSQLPAADGSGLTDMIPGMKDRYVSEMKEQLRELVERYDPDLLWIDGDWGGEAWWWTADDGRALYRFLRTLKPPLIVNDRVKRDCGLGDFRTPEQTVPESAPAGDWESCLTMNDHWGYHAEDRHWKSARDLIRLLAEAASKGGNLLLNVGPKPDGTIPWECRDRLKAVGRWMRSYGESIYGSSAGPFPNPPAWGHCTAKPGMLFAHVIEWPADRILRLPALLNVVVRAYPLCAAAKPLAFRRSGGGIEVELPARPADPWDSVIVLEVDGMPHALPEA